MDFKGNALKTTRFQLLEELHDHRDGQRGGQDPHRQHPAADHFQLILYKIESIRTRMCMYVYIAYIVNKVYLCFNAQKKAFCPRLKEYMYKAYKAHICLKCTYSHIYLYHKP